MAPRCTHRSPSRRPWISTARGTTIRPSSSPTPNDPTAADRARSQASRSKPVVLELLVEPLAGDAQGLRGLALVVVVILQRLEEDPLLDLLDHLFERALAGVDLVEDVLDLPDPRAQ